MSDIDFSELETIPHEEIVERSSNQERKLRTLDDEFNTLKDDRREQIKIVKSLRAAIGGIEEANSERKGLLKEFHTIKKKADLCRKTRDEMNRLIPPPASVLEEWIAETYVKLSSNANVAITPPAIATTILNQNNLSVSFFVADLSKGSSAGSGLVSDSFPSEGSVASEGSVVHLAISFFSSSVASISGISLFSSSESDLSDENLFFLNFANEFLR